MHGFNYIGSLGIPIPLGRFPGFYGPSLYAPCAIYVLISNPPVMIYVMQFEGSQTISFSRDQLLTALAGASMLAVAGAVLAVVAMNPSHRGSFFGRLSLKQYVAELWETRTCAPVGSGIDASRAHLLKFSRYGI